jgi:hypothetical protein
MSPRLDPLTIAAQPAQGRRRPECDGGEPKAEQDAYDYRGHYPPVGPTLFEKFMKPSRLFVPSVTGNHGLSVSLTGHTSLKEPSTLRSLGKVPRPARTLSDKTDYRRSSSSQLRLKSYPSFRQRSSPPLQEFATYSIQESMSNFGLEGHSPEHLPLFSEILY